MRGMIFCVFLWGMLWGEVCDHLREVRGKHETSSIEGIDYIYMINLDERPEKWARASSQLLRYGIVPYRFSAVNGWELPMEVLGDVGVLYEPWMQSGTMGTYYTSLETSQHEIVRVPDRRYFSHCMSRGAVGIALSHLSILKDALESGYETIWVLEDDVEVLRDPHELADLIEILDDLVGKGGWDILFTDRDTRNNYGQYVPCTGYAWRPNYVPHDVGRFARREAVGEQFTRVGARFGAYSMVVRRSGMEKLFRFFENYQLFLPYDIEMTLPNGIRLFSLVDDMVVPQLHALSDNGAPNYRK